MKNLDQDPVVLTGRMGDDAINMAPAAYEEVMTSSFINNRRPTQSHHNYKIWRLWLTAVLFAMYPSLAQVCQLKFTNKSPFEIHVFFSNMGVVAYVVAIPAAVAFFKMANTSRVCIYMILRCIFCFSVILANLSLVLVLFIPTRNYYWIGYLIISLLFVFIVTYNVIDYLKSRSVRRDKKHHQRKESSSSDSMV